MKRLWRGILVSALLLITSRCASGGGGGFFGCGAWSAWRSTGTICDNRFWCFGKNQKGTYDTAERTRQCSNGIQRETSKSFNHCGC